MPTEYALSLAPASAAKGHANYFLVHHPSLAGVSLHKYGYLPLEL